MKSDWTTLQASFKTQFELKIDVETNKYLLLQRVITLTQKKNEEITNYFRRAKSLARHLSSSTKTIDYNVVKNMKNRSQKEHVNFKCNKNRNFFLKKIKQVIQAVYQTIDTMNSFDSKWRQIQSNDSFNLFKEKSKTLSTNE
jgi:hypothetical protein